MVLLVAVAFTGTVGSSLASSTEPVIGPWKGKTKQGFPIYLGVREGPAVTNVRLTYKDVICGKANLKNQTLTMTVDEYGHFSGVVYPNNGGVEVEGSFAGPNSVRGAIVAGEGSGLPGCVGGRFPFTAHPQS